MIIEQGADYVLSLKGNQGTLHQEVQDLFKHTFETEFVDIKYDFHQTTVVWKSDAVEPFLSQPI